MTALRELQRSFQAWVVGSASTLPPAVAGTGAVSAEDRLDIYATAIRLRFLEVLGQDYPGLHALAGAEEFRRLGLAYVEAHPSHHPSIRWFGEHLPAFLRSTAPWREQPALAEMAGFEWAKGELLDAADSTVVGVADIAAIPPDRWAGIRPRLKPAVRRLALEWNVPVAWKAIDADEPPRHPSAWIGRWSGCCGAMVSSCAGDRSSPTRRGRCGTATPARTSARSAPDCASGSERTRRPCAPPRF